MLNGHRDWCDAGITENITFLELFPIVVALYIWGDQLKNKKIKFFCDNMSVVHIINSMTCKSEAVMRLVRCCTLLCLKFNLVVKSSHVPGVNNTICDALSRLQMEKFRVLAPEAEEDPCPVPDHLWELYKRDLLNL